MESIAVDDLDRQLTQCLGVDGRASFSAIAAVLGVSDQTVARRYRRLRSSGLLRIVGLPAPKTGGGTSWVVRMRCVPGSGEALAVALARRPDTAWVQLLSGDTEVLCSLRGQPHDHASVLLTRLPRSGRIVAVTAYSRLHQFTGGKDALGFLQVLPDEQTAPLRQPVHDRRLEPSDIDDALFAALALDGRTSYADLAAAAGWSESAVRRRLELLRESGALHFDLEIDTSAYGFRTSAWLWISVPPSELATTGETLAKFPEIAYAIATTGPANLAACVVCRDETELYEFLTEKIGSLPGVERVETSPIIRTVKQASPVVAPTG